MKYRSKAQKKNSRKYFEDLVYENIDKMYPKYKAKDLGYTIETNVKDFDAIFAELWKIHKSKKKYDLHRALKYANQQFHTILTKITQQEIKPRMTRLQRSLHQEHNFDDEYECKSCFSHIQKITFYKESAFKRKARYFKIISYMVSLIDVAMFVILLLLLSYLSKIIDSLISGTILGFIFIVVITFLKVIVDRFVIIPRVHKLGRSLYIRTLNRYKKVLAQYEAMSVVITNAEHTKKSNRQIIKLLQHGAQFIQKARVSRFRVLR